MDKKTQQIAIPFISVLLGILLGAIIMWIFGYDALWGYEELFKTAFGSIKNIGEIFRTMGPLILIALGFAVASRAGFSMLVYLVKLWQVGLQLFGLPYLFQPFLVLQCYR